MPKWPPLCDVGGRGKVVEQRCVGHVQRQAGSALREPLNNHAPARSVFCSCTVQKSSLLRARFTHPFSWFSNSAPIPQRRHQCPPLPLRLRHLLQTLQGTSWEILSSIRRLAQVCPSFCRGPLQFGCRGRPGGSRGNLPARVPGSKLPFWFVAFALSHRS